MTSLKNLGIWMDHSNAKEQNLFYNANTLKVNNMKKDKSVDVFNTLIGVNNERIKGYETALKETNEADLKIMFSQFEQTSQEIKSELVDEVQKLIDMSVTGTKTAGKAHRAWLDYRGPLTGKDRTAILNSCEYGEIVAVNAYEEALENNLDDLTDEQQTMLYKQQAQIKTDQEAVKILQDKSLEHASL